MNRDRFTLKANSAIDESVKLAAANGNQEITPLHITLAILSDPENIVPEVIKKTGADINRIISSIEREIEKLPKIQGATDQYLDKDFKKILDQAETTAKQFKDDYVSTEHMFLAIIDLKDIVAKILNGNGINRENFLRALMDIRGNQKITDQNPEEKMQTLKRY
ncbi:MAG TPA: Clp protease N-terminal domain-containing protein, partial [Candidatus Deferrimicrobium sp.]|nr:Clp protease N-terminal domain-containing protein [Candidatus Deferrimicrobium sp.]